MDVHLRELRVFVAVAEQLSVARAAETLFLARDEAATHLQRLAVEVRAELVTQEPGHAAAAPSTVTLTPAGRALLPAARTVLAAWQDAEAALAELGTAPMPTLVVGVSTGLGRGLLPAVGDRFAERVPEARLRLRQVGPEDPTAGLAVSADEGTDLAFVWLPVPHAERFRWLPVAAQETTDDGARDLVLAWRRDDHRPLVRSFVDSVRAELTATAPPPPWAPSAHGSR